MAQGRHSNRAMETTSDKSRPSRVRQAGRGCTIGQALATLQASNLAGSKPCLEHNKCANSKAMGDARRKHDSSSQIASEGFLGARSVPRSIKMCMHACTQSLPKSRVENIEVAAGPSSRTALCGRAQLAIASSTCRGALAKADKCGRKGIVRSDPASVHVIELESAESVRSRSSPHPWTSSSSLAATITRSGSGKHGAAFVRALSHAAASLACVAFSIIQLFT